MKKMKTLLLSLAIGFTVAAAATAVGCNKDNGGATSSDWFAGEEENVVEIKFNNPSVKVNQYESAVLDYSVKGTASAVTFSSSDPTIASVDENGIVSAASNVGTVTITATVDGISATCEVVVQTAPYAPEIILNQTEYIIENGETLSFTVETEWNQSVLDEEIVYAASFAENSKDAAATVSVEGNLISVKGNAIETVDVIVSTTVRGIYTSKQITVSVVAPSLKIKSADANFLPGEGVYSTAISTTSLIGDMANSLPLDFVVSKGAQTIDADIAWTVDGDAVAVEEGNLVGKKIGTATLSGTVSYEGEEATVQVVCDVIPPEVHLDQPAVLEVEDLATLKLEQPLLDGDKIQSVDLHGKKISGRVIGKSINFVKSEFPTASKDLGEQQIVITTNLVRYTMDVTIYTMVINNADELNQMRLLADTGEIVWNDRYQVEKPAQFYDGYFVLGNDIAYNNVITNMTDTGSVWWASGASSDLSRGFKGIFDGMGYNIDGLCVGKNPSGSDKEAGGLFGYLSTSGIVRNVSFTNAELYSNCGFICAAGNGLIENVSVSYKKIGNSTETNGINGSNPTKMGTFFSYIVGNNATVRNCLVDASAAEINIQRGVYNGIKTNNLGLVGKAPNVENVIAICPNEEVLKESGADIKVHTYTELMRDTSVFDEFDSSIWTVTEHGVPMFVNQAATIDADKTVEFLNIGDTLVAGFEMVILTNNPYVMVEVEDVAGVTYKDGILTATDEAFTKTVTLTATSLFNPAITATHTVYIDSFGTKVEKPTSATPTLYNSTPVLTIGDNSWMGEENYVYFGAEVIGSGTEQIVVDGWQKLAWGKNNVTVVSVKNGVRENFTVDVILDYTRADVKDATKIAESAFSTTRVNGSEYTLVDVDPADSEKATGFNNVEQLNCSTEWSTALFYPVFLNMDISEYSDVWFALKIVNGHWVMQTVNVETSDWVYFHYTQTSDKMWAAEVSFAGSTYKIEYDISGKNANTIRELLYRSGWANGFLMYNNGGNDVNESTPTSIYATEVLGVKKAN